MAAAQEVNDIVAHAKGPGLNVTYEVAFLWVPGHLRGMWEAKRFSILEGFSTLAC